MRFLESHGTSERRFSENVGHDQPLSKWEQEIIRWCGWNSSQEVVGWVERDTRQLQYEEHRKYKAHLLRNVSKRPETEFELCEQDVLHLYAANVKKPGSVYMVWHSHPGGSMLPSTADAQNHPLMAPLMGIVVNQTRSLHWYANDSCPILGQVTLPDGRSLTHR